MYYFPISSNFTYAKFTYNYKLLCNIHILLVILFMLFLFNLHFLSDTTICSSIPMYHLAISFTGEFFYTVVN